MLKKSLLIFLGFEEKKNVNENEISELLLAFYSEAMRWSRAGEFFGGENINTMAYMKVDGWFSGGGWLKKTFLLPFRSRCLFLRCEHENLYFCVLNKIYSGILRVSERATPAHFAACNSRVAKFEAAHYRSYGIANQGRLNGSIVLNGEGKCASYFNWMRSRTFWWEPWKSFFQLLHRKSLKTWLFWWNLLRYKLFLQQTIASR